MFKERVFIMSSKMVEKDIKEIYESHVEDFKKFTCTDNERELYI